MSGIAIFLMVLFYFIPSLIAAPGRRASIFVLNLFFGWTFIGWVIALFMAVRSAEAVKS